MYGNKIRKYLNDKISARNNEVHEDFKQNTKEMEVRKYLIEYIAILHAFISLYASHQYEKRYWKINCKCKIRTESHMMQKDGSSCGIFVMKVS